MNKEITIMLDTTFNIIRNVFLSEEEKEMFLLNNKYTSKMSSYGWATVRKDNVIGLVGFTPETEEIKNAIKSVFKSYNTKTTIQAYKIKVLEYKAKNKGMYYKYFKSDRQIEIFAHYYNTIDFYNWDISEEEKRIIYLPFGGKLSVNFEYGKNIFILMGRIKRKLDEDSFLDLSFKIRNLNYDETIKTIKTYIDIT